MISSTKAQLLTFCFRTEYLLHFKNSDIFWLLTATAIHFYVLCIVIHVIQDVHPGYHMTFSCLSLYALYSWDSKYGFLWFWWCFAGMLVRCCRIHLCWNLSRYFFPIIRHLGFIRQVLQKHNVSPILPIEPATNIFYDCLDVDCFDEAGFIRFLPCEVMVFPTPITAIFWEKSLLITYLKDGITVLSRP